MSAQYAAITTRLHTLPAWSGRFFSVRVGAGGKTCDQALPILWIGQERGNATCINTSFWMIHTEDLINKSSRPLRELFRKLVVSMSMVRARGDKDWLPKTNGLTSLSLVWNRVTQKGAGRSPKTWLTIVLTVNSRSWNLDVMNQSDKLTGIKSNPRHLPILLSENMILLPLDGTG